jgi:divalent metal cation (Fe/Co/Zn/Cd) transporter
VRRDVRHRYVRDPTFVRQLIRASEDRRGDADAPAATCMRDPAARCLCGAPNGASMEVRDIDRPRALLVRRGLLLNWIGIGYNVLEAIVAVMAGLIAGSVALVGFGFDSVIEVTASGAAQWRLRADVDRDRRERAERATERIIGWSFLALAAYVAFEGIETLVRRDAPERSVVGLVLLALSAVVMPWLARAKRRVARAMSSRALEADAMQTSLCAYLSVIALAGVALNALLGWWWADPVSALAMVPIIALEGVEGVRGNVRCGDGCC